MSMSFLDSIPPAKLGLPEWFEEFRPTQLEAIQDALDDEARFSALQVPTGVGKSIIGVVLAKLGGRRGLYLTFTKALQDQLARDFSKSAGAVVIKGRSNYGCVETGGSYTCEEMADTCRTTRAKGDDCLACPYQAIKAQAVRAPLVITNYAYWTSLSKVPGDQGPPLGQFDTLILDEAHHAPEGICDILAIEYTPSLLRIVGCGLPSDAQSPQAWKTWAVASLARLNRLDSWSDDELTRASGGDSIRARNLRKKAKAALNETAELSGQWAVDQDERAGTWAITPVWAYRLAERALFQGIPKVVLMSGTLTRKTMARLGIARENYDWHQYAYAFPRRQAPIYWVKRDGIGVALRHNMSDETRANWLGIIAAIVAKRADRKGIIHTGSYARAQEIVEYWRAAHPERAELLMTHSARELGRAVDEFRRSRRPLFIVSPSLTTGYDFPKAECEVCIVAKLPFPYSVSNLYKARQKDDSSYSLGVMFQTLIQAAKRGMRSSDDWCETFITDDSLAFALARGRSNLPSWFVIKRVDHIPKAPRALFAMDADADG